MFQSSCSWAVSPRSSVIMLNVVFLRTGMSKLGNIFFSQYSAALSGCYSVSGGSRGINILSPLHLPVYAEDGIVYAIVLKLHLLRRKMLSLLLLLV